MQRLVKCTKNNANYLIIFFPAEINGKPNRVLFNHHFKQEDWDFLAQCAADLGLNYRAIEGDGIEFSDNTNIGDKEPFDMVSFMNKPIPETGINTFIEKVNTLFKPLD